MGDRGNIVIKQDHPEDKDERVFLYSHWGGYRIKQTLQKALAKNMRWDHHSYLTRIIFCEMLDGDLSGETGFGIATSPPDNEYPYLVVDCENQCITEEDADTGATLNTWTFSDFVADTFKEE